MKWTMTPALASQAMKAISDTSKAVAAASAAKRIVFPPVISPTDAPITSEIADVTETGVSRDPQKIQNTRPPNKQAYKPACGGKRARDASPKAAGSKYAASVMPARRSKRNQ